MQCKARYTVYEIGWNSVSGWPSLATRGEDAAYKRNAVEMTRCSRDAIFKKQRRKDEEKLPAWTLFHSRGRPGPAAPTLRPEPVARLL